MSLRESVYDLLLFARNANGNVKNLNVWDTKFKERVKFEMTAIDMYMLEVQTVVNIIERN